MLSQIMVIASSSLAMDGRHNIKAKSACHHLDELYEEDAIEKDPDRDVLHPIIIHYFQTIEKKEDSAPLLDRKFPIDAQWRGSLSKIDVWYLPTYYSLSLYNPTKKDLHDILFDKTKELADLYEKFMISPDNRTKAELEKLERFKKMLQ